MSVNLLSLVGLRVCSNISQSCLKCIILGLKFHDLRNILMDSGFKFCLLLDWMGF